MAYATRNITSCVADHIPALKLSSNVFVRAQRPYACIPRKEASWSDLSLELHLIIYNFVEYRIIRKPLPGSQEPNDKLHASFPAHIPAARLQGVNCTTFEEIRSDQQIGNRYLAWEAGHGMIAVHWECRSSLAAGTHD
jgi:hypothetical protein